MPQARDEAGNIWEVDAQGNAVRLVEPAPQTSGSVFTLPPDPTKVAAQERQAAKDAADAADKAADNAREDRKLALAEDKAARDSSSAASSGKSAASSAQRADAIAAYKTANQMDALIRDMERKFEKGPGSTSGVAGVADYFPTIANDQFDKAASSVRGQVGTLLGFTGGQLNAIKEAELAVGPYIANSSDYDATALDKIERLKGLANLARERSVAILGGIPDDNGTITPVEGQQAENELDKAALVGDTSPPGMPPVGEGGNDPGNGPEQIARGGGLLGLGGGTRRISNDRANAMVNSLINAGASEATINAALNNMGLPSAPLGSLAAARAWVKNNPGKRYDAANVYEEVPLSFGERIAGSDIGAGLANYANAATAGTVGALAGERGKGALDAMQELSPTASMAGSILGGITGAAGAEIGLASRLAGTGLARFAPRVADAAYGGLFGFNAADEGEGATGALVGAATGVLGGAVGERVARGAGRAIRGVSDPAVQRLRQAGIPMTFGRAVGQSGPVGAAIKKAEEAAVSYPGVGSVVGARFDDDLRGLNRAAFEIGAETTGNQVQDVGSNGLGQLRQLVGNTYDQALNNGVRLDVTDPNVAQGVINAQMSATSIPQVGGRAADSIDYRVGGGTDVDGMMTGRDFQEAYRGLGRDGRAAARGDDLYAQEVQGALGQAQDALAMGLEAQNPGAYTGFVNANTANRRAMVLADAVNSAKNQTDEMFTPAQLNAADANSATRLTGRLNSASGNRPFHQLAQDAQQVIGNRLPNSGTTDRALTGLAIGGATGGGLGYAAGDPGTGAATGLGLTLAAMAGGSGPAQRAAVAALLDRPEALRAAGEALARNAQIGSWSGAGVLTPLLVSP